MSGFAHGWLLGLDTPDQVLAIVFRQPAIINFVVIGWRLVVIRFIHPNLVKQVVFLQVFNLSLEDLFDGDVLVYFRDAFDVLLETVHVDGVGWQVPEHFFHQVIAQGFDVAVLLSLAIVF